MIYYLLNCFIIQSVLNCFFFDTKKKLNQFNNPVIECSLDKKKSINNGIINKKEDKESAKNKNL